MTLIPAAASTLAALLLAASPASPGLHSAGPPLAATVAENPLGLTGPSLARSHAGTVSSFNSAGYAVSRGGIRFRSVRATFFVPYLTCRLSKGASSADWVGLDGFTAASHTVEQAGLEADCSTKGKASYRVWHTMYPRGRVYSKIRVSAGDSLTAVVSYDPASARFRLSVTDSSTGASFTDTAACPSGHVCRRSSAEVISSASDTRKDGKLIIRPLADYGAVSFASISLTDNLARHGGLRSSHWGSSRIIDTERAAPYALVARPTQTLGSAFDVYWSKLG